jgi:hypothetical protein
MTDCYRTRWFTQLGIGCCLLIVTIATPHANAQVPAPKPLVTTELFTPLTEPQCSYCATQHRKKLIADDDLVVAWIRGPHNGGAISVRHFLAGTRVINDTYGLFFYDPEGGYVAAYKKDYGYKFHGWRNGSMIVQGRDGTLWSALSGVAIEGPHKGKRLERIPHLATHWGHWLMLHPESTAYDLFDGKKYAVTSLPKQPSQAATDSRGPVDPRLAADAPILGIEVGNGRLAVPLDAKAERVCWLATVADKPVAAFWYGPTQSAVAFSRVVDDRTLTFYADEISPETAPFKDTETGTRWTLAGRGVDGPLKGKELDWVPSLQCRWFAWSAENPQTDVLKSVGANESNLR